MLNLLKKTLNLALLAGVASTALCSNGCQEAATAATAVNVAQATASALQQMPGWVQNMLESLQTQKKADWGKPEQIIVTDTNYIFMYPTSKAELRKNQGIPRMIIIPKSMDPSVNSL